MKLKPFCSSLSFSGRKMRLKVFKPVMWCVALWVVLTTSSVSGKLKALEPRVLATKFAKRFGITFSSFCTGKAFFEL